MNKKKMGLSILIFLIIMLITDCIPSSGIRYETIVRQPKPSNYPIEIVDLTNANRPYKVIGVVQAEKKIYGLKATIKQLKIQARKMGGDALLDLHKEVSSDGGMMIPAGGLLLFAKGEKEVWTAKVIVWEQ